MRNVKRAKRHEGKAREARARAEVSNDPKVIAAATAEAEHHEAEGRAARDAAAEARNGAGLGLPGTEWPGDLRTRALRIEAGRSKA